jgi:hypothetical protein
VSYHEAVAVELEVLASLPVEQRPSVIVLAIAGMPVTDADIATHNGNQTAAQLAAVIELATQLPGLDVILLSNAWCSFLDNRGFF